MTRKKIMVFFFSFIIFNFYFFTGCGGGGGKEDGDAGGEAEEPVDGGIEEVGEIPLDILEEGKEETVEDGGIDSTDLDVIEGEIDVEEGDVVEEGEEIPEREFRLVLQFSSYVIETQIEGGFVDVECFYEDRLGNVLPSPSDMEIYTTATDFHLDGARFSFDEIGEKEFVCASGSLGLETRDSVIVAYEGIDRSTIRLSEFSNFARHTLKQILASADMDDPDGYLAGIQEIETNISSIRGEYFNDYTFFVYNPLGWPSRSQLESAGFAPNSDDSTYMTQLNELSNRLNLLMDEWQRLDSHALDSTIVGNIISRTIDVRNTVENIGRLSPSEIGFMESRSVWSDIVARKLAPVVRVSEEKLTEALRWYGPGGGGLGGSKFTLVEMLVDLAISEIIDALPSYEKLLKDAGKAATASALMMVISGLIDRQWPALPDGPVFDSVHGSAAGFLLPGNPWIAVGSNFNRDTMRNMAIFIPPSVGLGYVDVVDDILSAGDGLLSDPNILKRVKKWVDIVRTLVSQVVDDGLDPTIITLFPESVDIGPDMEFMYFGPCPTGVNPSMFPVVGILIPVNLDVGRGPSINVNVLSG